MVYRHELFQQGQPALLSGMSTKRKKKDKKGKTKRQSGDDSGEPSESLTGEEETTEEQEFKEEGKAEQRSPLLYAALPRRETHSESKSQEVQHRLSMASALASTRISERPGFVGGPPFMMPSGAALPPQLQALQQQQQQQNWTQNQLPGVRDRLQSLYSPSSTRPLQLGGGHDHVQLQLQLLQQQQFQQQQRQQRGHLTLEMITQRQLAASASSPGNRQVDDRLASLLDPSYRALYGMSSSPGTMSNLRDPTPLGVRPSALEQGGLSDFASAMRLQQSSQAQASASGFSPSLNSSISNLLGSQGIGLPDPRAVAFGQALGRSPTQLSARPAGFDSTLLEFASRSNQAASSLGFGPGSQQQQSQIFSAQLQLQLEQERQAAAAAAFAAASGVDTVARANPEAARLGLSQSSLSDQQLLEMILERQRQEAEWSQQDQQR